MGALPLSGLTVTAIEQRVAINYPAPAAAFAGEPRACGPVPALEER